ncbi:hypothetical protein AVV20_gp24 [Bacillus phage Palmer]|uniref:Uncharacterized protein n=1 Tax=Bacillus phage Palmer TaxID=1597966 RepID=A0A0C5ACE6_9CAUD|nr:hypothetical protein AVV20_gp24 [Bacillus phage Palmer]AJK28091.1 hypothetical protein CPT_Palmer24 [Bacillus phage Palmer]
MSENTVTAEYINSIIDNSFIEVDTKFDKVTVVTLKTPSGFVLVEAAGAVDPANYDVEIGKKICLERITNKLWELEGYVLQKQLKGVGVAK